MQTGQVKFRAGKYLVKGSIDIEHGRDRDKFILRWGFSPGWKDLKDEVKCMEGVRWHGFDEVNPRKVWSLPDTRRNRFQLDYLTGGNPYARYDAPLIEWEARARITSKGLKVHPYHHQEDMTRHVLTRKHCIIAGEMGVGKTLAAICAMEESGFSDCYWIGPRSALDAVRLEFYKWKGKYWPTFMTYEALVRHVQAMKTAPRIVIFDECSKVKNSKAQRSQAAFELAEMIRNQYSWNSYIVLMSGTPSPKDPSDWWFLTEVACPGWFKEGNPIKFKNRLAIIEQSTGYDGGSYPKLVTWRDNPKKCNLCGQYEDAIVHDLITIGERSYHKFEPSVDEVSLLYKRMGGLVMVKLKKDCLDLPEKIYRKVYCEPTMEILNAAKLIVAAARTTIEGATLLRELSDGFQYKDRKSGEVECPVCKGSKEKDEYYDADDPNEMLDSESISCGHRVIFNEDGVRIGVKEEPLKLATRKIPCDKCSGTGKIDAMERDTVHVQCPKEQALIDLLEQYEDEGRLLIWAGFTGSVDRCTQICVKHGWNVIRLDGRGWWSTISGKSLELLRVFDEEKETYKKIAWIGQPGAGGMGLNLTAASAAVYYSNTFKGEDRWQSEDRLHRPGADHNRGVTIWDIIHLPSDEKILINLQEKRELQSLTMGIMREAIEQYVPGQNREV